MRVLGKDLKTLGEGEWLNGPIIQYYLSMLAEGSSTYIFSTYFYTSYSDGGYSKVAKWTSKIDIFSFDKLLVPVHLGGHWVLVVVDNRRQTVIGYDSMGNDVRRWIMTVKRYLKDEYEERKGSDFDPYTTIEAGSVPIQENYDDCGILLLLFAERIIHDMDVADIDPAESNTSFQRSLIIWEIVNGKRLVDRNPLSFWGGHVVQ